MAKRFTRNIQSIKDIEKQPKYTNEQNDLLSDDKHVYVRNKDKYENLTNSVKSVNGKEPDEQGNIKVDNIEQIENAADQAKDDIQTSVSDVQSTQAGAEKDISSLVESTESARDEAIETMTKLDYSDRNLLPGTSDEWKKQTFTSWTEEYVRLSLNELGLKVGDTMTYAVDIDNTLDEQNTDDARSSITFRDPSDSQITDEYTSTISGGKIGRAIMTVKIPEGTSVIRIAKYSKHEGTKEKTFAIRKAKLQLGTQATPWAPAPEDIALKSEIEQIKQAIIDLGGSI